MTSTFDVIILLMCTSVQEPLRGAVQLLVRELGKLFWTTWAVLGLRHLSLAVHIMEWVLTTVPTLRMQELSANVNVLHKY